MSKKIMLACAAGMSTSLLVTKMEKAAAEQGLDYTIYAVPAGEADTYVNQDRPDAILLGPQVRYLKDQFTEKYAAENIPVAVIDMIDYGMMNGEKVLDSAKELLK
jgi:PTS system cellobiose-specific IIB component